MQTLQPGTTLLGGKYFIKKVLGQGGFGITYLAGHTMLGTDVAIKEFFMKDFCNRDEKTDHVSIVTNSGREQVTRFRDKFLKEVKNIAKLNHPNIVRIIEVFEENDTAYYVMDYCAGGSLSDLVKLNNKGLGESLALKYIRQVASALKHIHQQKMNHLDVKPANILLNSYGDAVLIDFGLSKQYDTTGSQTSTTPVGISHGYAPIEQYKQGGVSEFSPATDIYSLGATLYKLITGQTPPDAQALIEETLPAFNASAEVTKAIQKAMQPRRADRPQSIEQWLSILNAGKVTTDDSADETTQMLQEETKIPTIESTQKAVEYPTSKQSKQTKEKKGNKFIAITLSIIAVVGIIAGIIGFIALSDSPKSASMSTEEEDSTNMTKMEIGTVSYYGTMIGYPMVLRLTTQQDGTVEGWYKNINYGAEARVWGTVSAAGYELNMMANGHNTTFSLKQSKNGLVGEYYNEKSLEVILAKVKEVKLSGQVGSSSAHFMLWKDKKKVTGIYYYDQNSSNKKFKYKKLEGTYSSSSYELKEYSLKDEPLGTFTFSKNYSGTYTDENGEQMNLNLYETSTY